MSLKYSPIGEFVATAPPRPKFKHWKYICNQQQPELQAILGDRIYGQVNFEDNFHVEPKWMSSFIDQHWSRTPTQFFKPVRVLRYYGVFILIGNWGGGLCLI